MLTTLGCWSDAAACASRRNRRPELVLPRDRVVHHLHRDRPVEHGIPRLVDDAHRTLADELEDVVLPDVRDLWRLLHAALLGEVQSRGAEYSTRSAERQPGPANWPGPVGSRVRAERYDALTCGEAGTVRP